MHRHSPLAFVALLAVAMATASGAAQVTPPREQSPARELFTYRSHFWLNLHHFLYEQATAKGEAVASTAGWPEGERAAWEAAVTFYRQHLASRDLLFGEGMVALRDQLAALGEAAPPPAVLVEKDLAPILGAATPVYRARFWAAHDAANRAFVERLQPLVAQHGALAERLGTLYLRPWPREPVLVDVTIHAGWPGAYATIDPTHVTVASRDPRHQGEAALEIVFHEASHGLIRPLSEALQVELDRQQKVLPRQDLWHAVLFFTTGEAVRERLSDYRPYAEAQGLDQRGAWKAYFEALRQHWLPYLKGETDFPTAVRRLVESAGQPRPPSPSGTS